MNNFKAGDKVQIIYDLFDNNIGVKGTINRKFKDLFSVNDIKNNKLGDYFGCELKLLSMNCPEYLKNYEI